MTHTYPARFDPRTKLVFALCVSAMALILGSFLYLVPLFFISLLAAAVACRGGRLPFNTKRLSYIFGLFAVVALLQSVFSPGGRVILGMGNVRLLTAGGLSSGCTFLLRISVIMLSAAVLASEEERRTIQGLIQWKMPYELAFMTLIALHFIPVFADEFQNSLTALQLRGVVIKKVPMGKRLRVYASLLYPVVADMVVKSQEMALAMEMRGFRAFSSRTSYTALRLRGRDYAAMAGIAFLTVLLICLYFVAAG